MLGEVFPLAARHLSTAVDARRRLMAQWANLTDAGLLEEFAVTDPDGSGRVAVRAAWPDGAQEALTETLRSCVAALWACLDALVQEAAHALSVLQRPRTPNAGRFFPVADGPEAFDALLQESCLDGILMAQQRLVSDCQPFRDSPSAPAAVRVRDAIRRLLSWTHELDDGALVAAWVTPVEPRVETDGTRELLMLDVAAPSSLEDDEAVVATYRAERGVGGLTASTGSYVDPALCRGFLPSGPDDTFDARLRATISGVALLAGLFTRCMEDSPPARRLPPPTHSTPATWEPASSSRRRWSPQELADLQASELGIGVVQDSDGLLFLLSTAEGVFERRIPGATPLNPYLRSGTAAESAAHDAAATWGLPDFVLMPETVHSGSRNREVSDGLLVAGDRGVVLQVKNREAPGHDVAKEASWMDKKIAQAARQIHGTIRRLRAEPIKMTNGRGRAVRVDGPAIAWVGAVIVDHPDPPAGHPLSDHSFASPVVTLLRRDWEFLFDQLRSTRAVIDYLHRVGGSSAQLGGEPERYFELAVADAAADPSPVESALVGDRHAVPLLPMEPVGHRDDPAHGIVRMICEDIATSPLDAEEHERIELLAAIDRLPVGFRTDLGRLVLDELGSTRTAEDGNVRWRFRSYRAPLGEPQLGFGVCSVLSDETRAGFRSWLLLRHHERGPIEDTLTVGVLLTPRGDDPEGWDTTMIAVRGDPHLEDVTLTFYRELWNIDGRADSPRLA